MKTLIIVSHTNKKKKYIMHLSSKKLCALVCISLSTIVLPSDQRTEQRRQRHEARTARQQEREEQAQLQQAQEEAQSAKRKSIADTAKKQLARKMAKLAQVKLPRRIDATKIALYAKKAYEKRLAISLRLLVNMSFMNHA